MKLLIVDDCVDSVNILSSLLGFSGHQIQKAQNGIEALELLRNNSYEVVITDAEMPGMGGVELCRFIKSDFPDLYIIGISGSFRSLQELKAAGADICFPKPFHIDAIEKAIEDRMLSLSLDRYLPVVSNDSGRLIGTGRQSFNGHLF